MSIGVVGVQFEGASVFGLGVGPVPLFLQHVCQEDMRFRKVRIEFQRFSGCADYFRARLFRRSADKNRAEVAYMHLPGRRKPGANVGSIFIACSK